MQFDGFGAAEAWEVGLALKAVGETGRLPIVVDIRLATMTLLAFALPGSAPDNFDWARRKRNVVLPFPPLLLRHRASVLALEGRTLQDLGALPERDYAVHGGSVPIVVKGTGCVGAVTIWGCRSETIIGRWSRPWRGSWVATSVTSRWIELAARRA